jgi:phosphoglycerol transferase MdoB-like AlkP superfamily enzyme
MALETAGSGMAVAVFMQYWTFQFWDFSTRPLFVFSLFLYLAYFYLLFGLFSKFLDVCHLSICNCSCP